MPRYLVISNHTGPDCTNAIRQVLAIGYLTHYDWGCKDGVHTGWAVIEGESKAEALMSVPTFLRDKAQVVELTKFEPGGSQKMHG